MQKVYTKDFSDLEGTFIRMFIYDEASIEDARAVDHNFIYEDYSAEIEQSGFYFHDIPVNHE